MNTILLDSFYIYLSELILAVSPSTALHESRLETPPKICSIRIRLKKSNPPFEGQDSLALKHLSAAIPGTDHCDALHFKTTKKEHGNLTVHDKNSNYAPVR